MDYENCRQMAILPHVKNALENRTAGQNSDLIATRTQRQEFWTRIMCDADADMKDRLRASELLGKSCCDFSEKLNLEHSGDIQLSWLPAESLTVEPVGGQPMIGV